MAKSYAERNAASIAATGKSLYQLRIEKGHGRGHHPGEKNSPPLKGKPRTPPAGAGKGGTPKKKIVTPAAPKPTTYKPPKITKRVEKLPAPAGQTEGKIVTSYSTNLLFRYVEKVAYSGATPQGRIYFETFNKKTGTWVKTYYGNRNKAHGITAQFFVDKVFDKMATGDYDSPGDAMAAVISEDMGQDDSPTDEESEIDPVDISQMRLYILPSRA